MIEETKKKENKGFGDKIIQSAQAIKDKRDLQKPKKNFLSEHAQTLKKWNEN